MIINVLLFTLCVVLLCSICAQMETGPVVASEPVFSAVSSVQRHVPLIPNGSGAQTKPAEFSGKLTAEKLAAIEDEELLDKMVRHAGAIILNDLSYYFDKSVF